MWRRCGRQHFSKGARILSIRFSVEWPDGKPFYDLGLSTTLCAKNFPNLATAGCRLLSAIAPPAAPQPQNADVVIYGATASGIVAAVQTARMGRSVILIEPGRFIGGMTTGGLGATDTGSATTVGGLAREFHRALYDHYRQPAAWTHGETRADYLPRHHLAVSEKLKLHWFFEPRVARALLEKWLAENAITVLRETPLDRENGVIKNGPRITEIRSVDGRRFAAAIFIDATYEGDLLAAAGAGFTIGREPNARHRETLNGIRFLPQSRTAAISLFVRPGDPASGLLPRILPQPPGAEGDGDHRAQSFNFRLCLTDAPENRRPFEKPDGYDPLQYELTLRLIQATPGGLMPGRGDGAGAGLLTLTPMPNRKTDSNNNRLFSTDCIGRSWDWPSATGQQRAQLLAEHQRYTQGCLWFLANDPRVPEKIRREMSRWASPATSSPTTTTGPRNSTSARPAASTANTSSPSTTAPDAASSPTPSPSPPTRWTRTPSASSLTRTTNSALTAAFSKTSPPSRSATAPSCQSATSATISSSPSAPPPRTPPAARCAWSRFS
jgi:hypothetical protein